MSTPDLDPEPRFMLASERAKRTRTPVWKVLIGVLAIILIVGLRTCYLDHMLGDDGGRRSAR